MPYRPNLPVQAVAITSVRTPLVPIGGPHMLTATGSLPGWETYGHSMTEWQSDPATGILVSDPLPAGCNVVLAAVVQHASDADGKTATMRVWIARQAGTSGKSRIAHAALECDVQGGLVSVPAMSGVLVPDDLLGPGSAPRRWADTITLKADHTLSPHAQLLGCDTGTGAGIDSIAQVVFEAAAGDQIIVAGRIGGSYTASGLAVLMGTM